MIQMINRIVDDQDYDFDELRGIHTVYSKNDKITRLISIWTLYMRILYSILKRSTTKIICKKF